MANDPRSAAWPDVEFLNQGLLPMARVNEIFREHNINYELSDPTTFSKYLTIMEQMSEDGLEGKSLLDFGCGLCVILAQAYRLGMKPVGIDQFGEYKGRGFEAARDILRYHGATSEEIEGIARYGSVLDSVPAFQGAFDFSISIGMLEHFHRKEDRRTVMLGLYYALKPGGSLFMICGPNIRFPIDFGHYGPKYVFLHCLPKSIRRLYLKLFAKGQNQNPEYLQGMSVKELITFVKTIDPDVAITNGFPILAKLMSGREFLKRPPGSWLLQIVIKALTSMKAEPLIFLIFTKPKT